MVLSQIHSFLAHSNCEQEREDNNNTLLAEKGILRTPPPKCKTLRKKFFPFFGSKRIIDDVDESWPSIFHRQGRLFNYTIRVWLSDSRCFMIKIEYLMRTSNHKIDFERNGSWFEMLLDIRTRLG